MVLVQIEVSVSKALNLRHHSNNRKIPGQGAVHLVLSTWEPSQIGPPHLGMGLSHFRSLLWKPWPQLELQSDHSDQEDHPPLTVIMKKYIFLEKRPKRRGSLHNAKKKLLLRLFHCIENSLLWPCQQPTRDLITWGFTISLLSLIRPFSLIFEPLAFRGLLKWQFYNYHIDKKSNEALNIKKVNILRLKWTFFKEAE